MSERRDIEAAADGEPEERERRYGGLLDSLFQGYAYWRVIRDEDGAIVDAECVEANAGHARATGVADIEGKRFSEVFFGIYETNPESIALYAGVVRTGVPSQDEMYVPALGRTMRVEVYRAGPEHFSAIVEDVSEQRRAEDLLRGVIEGTSDAVYVKDPDGRYLLFNEGAEAVVGRSSGEVLGRDDAELFGREQAAHIRARDLEVLDQHHPVTFEEQLPDMDGHTRTFLTTKGPMYDPYGRVTGIFGITRDITERTRMEREIRALNTELEKRVDERTSQLSDANEELVATNEELMAVNEELRSANEELAAATHELTSTNEELTATNAELDDVNCRLEEATAAKSEFLASMSHELRTPLNSILGFSGVLLQDMAGPLNDEQRRQIGMVANAGRHLLALINDVLDLSRIEAGILPMGIEPFAPGEAARQALESLAPQAAEHGLELILDDRTDGALLHSDPVRFQQILLNLVGNAVKFTHEGSVSLVLEMQGGGVRAVISDTGPGIAPPDLEKVFEDFYQVPHADGTKPLGTGLGLAVSRKTAVMLGGTLGAESPDAGGAVFTLVLPDLRFGPAGADAGGS